MGTVGARIALNAIGVAADYVLSRFGRARSDQLEPPMIGPELHDGLSLCHHLPMDTSTIDQAYGQLQGEFAGVAKSIHALATKLQTAAQSGDENAREWLLDLKQVALDVKDEQLQVNALLQAIHTFVDRADQHIQQQYPQVVQQAPPAFLGGGRRGGLFGGMLGGSFGQAIEMGAGIGLGEDLINSIF